MLVQMLRSILWEIWEINWFLKGILNPILLQSKLENVEGNLFSNLLCG